MALKTVAFFCFLSAFQVIYTEAFRGNYTYIPSTGAYYKYHPESTTWIDAKCTCHSEGAILFHPENADELNDVFRVFNIINGDWLATGISDLETLHVYKTVDGHDISQVYSNWMMNEPRSGSHNLFRCGFMDVSDRSLVVHECSNLFRYICKNKEIMKSMVTESEAVTDVKTIIADATNKIVLTLDRQTANQTKAFDELEQQAEVLHQIYLNQTLSMQQQENYLKLQAVYQNTALERLIEALNRQTEAMQRQAAQQAEVMKLQSSNQTEAIGQISEALNKQSERQSTNQNIVVALLAEALSRQTEILQQVNNKTTVIQKNLEVMAVNQTALMERQAQALKKLATLDENIGQDQQ